MKTGDFTGYKDEVGRDIHFGDTVKIGGALFEVSENPFNGLLVVDGDSGQQYLTNVYYICRVLPDVNEWTIYQKIGLARNSFVTTFLREPTAVFIGEDLLEVLKAALKKKMIYPDTYYCSLPGAKYVYQIMNMEVVPVSIDGYISVGFNKEA